MHLLIPADVPVQVEITVVVVDTTIERCCGSPSARNTSCMNPEIYASRASDIGTY